MCASDARVCNMCSDKIFQCYRLCPFHIFAAYISRLVLPPDFLVYFFSIGCDAQSILDETQNCIVVRTRIHESNNPKSKNAGALFLAANAIASAHHMPHAIFDWITHVRMCVWVEVCVAKDPRLLNDIQHSSFWAVYHVGDWLRDVLQTQEC